MAGSGDVTKVAPVAGQAEDQAEDQIANGAGISVAIADIQVAAPFPAGTGVIGVTTTSLAGVGAGIASTWTPNDSTLQLVDAASIGPAFIMNVVDDC